jgi:hypothetical protein
MNVKYIPNGNTKIVIDKVTYQNKGDTIAILPVDKLSKEEIESLLKNKFIREQKEIYASNDSVTSENKEEKSEEKPGKKKLPKDEKRKVLIEEAKKAGITFTDETSDEEIQKLISEAKPKE